MVNPRFCSYLWLLLVLAPVVARADLSQSQARKLIQALGGDSVRVQQIRAALDVGEQEGDGRGRQVAHDPELRRRLEWYGGEC